MVKNVGTLLLLKSDTFFILTSLASMYVPIPSPCFSCVWCVYSCVCLTVETRGLGQASSSFMAFHLSFWDNIPSLKMELTDWLDLLASMLPESPCLATAFHVKLCPSPAWRLWMHAVEPDMTKAWHTKTPSQAPSSCVCVCWNHVSPCWSGWFGTICVAQSGLKINTSCLHFPSIRMAAMHGHTRLPYIHFLSLVPPPIR